MGSFWHAFTLSVCFQLTAAFLFQPPAPTPQPQINLADLARELALLGQKNAPFNIWPLINLVFMIDTSASMYIRNDSKHLKSELTFVTDYLAWLANQDAFSRVQYNVTMVPFDEEIKPGIRFFYSDPRLSGAAWLLQVLGKKNSTLYKFIDDLPSTPSTGVFRMTNIGQSLQDFSRKVYRPKATWRVFLLSDFINQIPDPDPVKIMSELAAKGVQVVPVKVDKALRDEQLSKEITKVSLDKLELDLKLNVSDDHLSSLETADEEGVAEPEPSFLFNYVTTTRPPNLIDVLQGVLSPNFLLDTLNKLLRK